ncbi:tetratricopeptide repeat protein [Pseudomonas chlororaphis]|uniref:tetratricopeptide repeat protein n=1 Tax=Pseudomonas chlororaphis TaxID=587753 RepID=UPI002366617C|nr:tetratricopeptide repeat protein [Pseudomonas chlororaphis]WDH25963.1 tetratricopeptide repeat protein [Pseudomonas chlororaphis]
MPTKSFLPGLILALCAAASHCSVAAERKASQQSNNASTTLIESASQQYADGQLDRAAATLERALHIQPNNPATLHYLGVLRLQQGQYQQAEALATRSNMRVGHNLALRNRNLQLIQAAQKALASNNPPNADERLVAVREGLEEEVKRRREAETVAAEQPTPDTERRTETLTREAAENAANWPTGDRPSPEGQLRMTSAEPTPTYDEIEIPRGHRPPPGKCRIWFPDRPPGHQPKPGKCKKLRDRVPSGAYLVQG